MIHPVMVVEVVYRFEVLIAIQACIVMHLIDLEFPDFIFIRERWSGGIPGGNIRQLYMSHFAYACKMEFPA